MFSVSIFREEVVGFTEASRSKANRPKALIVRRP
jgi:hypothetical protein